jgi:alkylation response protein AidB-like acyl-CoA dehydrogenase
VNFLFDDDQELLRDSVRRLLQRDAPSAELRRLLDTDTGFNEALWRRAAELGTLSMLVPAEFGGGSLTGQGLVDAVLLAEEWGRALAPGPFVSTQVALAALSTFGSSEQRALLPHFVAGERIITWCVAEAGAGWDPALFRCTVGADGDGGLVLAGAKTFVEAADIADHYLVAALSDNGPIAVLIPADTAGITVEPHVSLDLGRRMSAVSFSGVPVARDAILPAADAAALDAQLRLAAVLACADSVGGAQRVVEMTVAYVKEREQFGRTIASFQAVKHRCADLLVLLENARAATHYAAIALDADAPDAPLAVSLAKAYVGDAYATITGEGTQLHGGIAFTWEYDMHLYVRRAKTNEVLFGTPAWHRARSWAALTRTGA